MSLNFCQRCDGEGEIANTEEGEPWSYWMRLPKESRLAIVLGLVRPVSCPECRGLGYDQVTND